MFAPIIIGIALESVVPLFPFFFRELVEDAPVGVEDIGVFAAQEFKNGFHDAHIVRSRSPKLAFAERFPERCSGAEHRIFLKQGEVKNQEPQRMFAHKSIIAMPDSSSTSWPLLIE